MSTDAAPSGWGRQAGPGPFWDSRGPGKAANASGGTNSREHVSHGGLEAASALGRQGTWQRSQESPGTDVRPRTSFVLGAAMVNAPGRWVRATLRDPLSLWRPEDTSSSSWPRASLGFWPCHPGLCIGHLLCSSSYEAPGHVDWGAPSDLIFPRLPLQRSHFPSALVTGAGVHWLISCLGTQFGPRQPWSLPPRALCAGSPSSTGVAGGRGLMAPPPPLSNFVCLDFDRVLGRWHLCPSTGHPHLHTSARPQGRAHILPSGLLSCPRPRPRPRPLSKPRIVRAAAGASLSWYPSTPLAASVWTECTTRPRAGRSPADGFLPLPPGTLLIRAGTF